MTFTTIKKKYKKRYQVLISGTYDVIIYGEKVFSIYDVIKLKVLRWRDCCFCSVAQSCPTLCNSMDCSTPGFPVLHHLLELAQTHVH